MTDPSEATPPLVQVVSGRPDAGDLAAIVAVLVARSGAQQGAGAGAGPRGGAGLWGAPSTMVRRGGGARPGGWGAASATLRG